MRPGGLNLTRRIVDYCSFPHDGKIADIGCGTGVTVEYLRDAGLDAVGIDVSKAALQRGIERAPDLPLIQAAGEALPFDNASMSGVLAECSLSVMQNAVRVLAECNRILMPGRKLALTDLYIRTKGMSSPSNCLAGRYISGVTTRDELQELLQESGFDILLWEDQSSYLKEFVAQYIMEHGSIEDLFQCVSTRIQHRQEDQSAKLGYFLLVAEKRKTTNAG